MMGGAVSGQWYSHHPRAGSPHTGIIAEYPAQPAVRLRCRRLQSPFRMNRVTHTHTAAMVQAHRMHPCCIDECVEQGPVRHRIAAIQHSFRFHGWGWLPNPCPGDRVRSPGAPSPSGAHQFIKGQSCFFALSLAQPADACAANPGRQFSLASSSQRSSDLFSGNNLLIV